MREFIKLKDYTLWCDGDVTVDHTNITNYLKKHKGTGELFVDQLTPQIEQFNKFCNTRDKISIKERAVLPTADWTTPEQYRNVDVRKLIQGLVVDYCLKHNLTDEQSTEAINRACKELELFESSGYFSILYNMLYIIDVFKNNNIVWGIGRGSSVSSFVLYLLEVHDVDSFKYELDFSDFLV